MRIMGIDYGTKRIGVAISAPLTGLAHPLETVPSPDGAISRDSGTLRPSTRFAHRRLPYNIDAACPSAEKAQEMGRQIARPQPTGRILGRAPDHGRSPQPDDDRQLENADKW